MAQLYAPYVLGSMTFAYLSKVMYDYTNTEVVEPMETVIEVSEITEKDTEVLVIPEEEVEVEADDEAEAEDEDEELFKCSKCLQKKPIYSFSKNQQKKKTMNMWKCKECTQ